MSKLTCNGKNALLRHSSLGDTKTGDDKRTVVDFDKLIRLIEVAAAIPTWMSVSDLTFNFDQVRL